MKAYAPAVFRFCLRALRDRSAADDALQNTFVDVYDSLPKFQKRSSVLTWSFGIARHRCLDADRTRKRWKNRFVNSLEEEPPSPTSSAEQGLHEHALNSIVLDCLGQLPAEIRLAVLMRCQEGLSYDEIARVTRERPGTLQMRVTRALPGLRACIEGKGAASHERRFRASEGRTRAFVARISLAFG